MNELRKPVAGAITMADRYLHKYPRADENNSIFCGACARRTRASRGEINRHSGQRASVVNRRLIQLRAAAWLLRVHTIHIPEGSHSFSLSLSLSLSVSVSPSFSLPRSASLKADRRRRHSTRFIISPRLTRCNGHLAIIGERTPRLAGRYLYASLPTRTTTYRDVTIAWVLVAGVRTCFWVANCTSTRRRHVVTCGRSGAHTRGAEERAASRVRIMGTEAYMVYGGHKTHLLRVINGYTGPGLPTVSLACVIGKSAAREYMDYDRRGVRLDDFGRDSDKRFLVVERAGTFD